MSPHKKNSAHVFALLCGFLFCIPFIFPQPVRALCCKCHAKTKPSDNICLTDTVATDCTSLLAKNASNKNLENVSCDPPPSAPDTFDESAKCKPLTSGGSALCNIGPVAAIDYKEVTKADTGTVIQAAAPELNIPIPGLNFAKNISSVDGYIEIPYLAQYITAVFQYLLGIVVLAAAVMIVYGGFKYVLSSTITSIKSGKEIISDALIGLVIAISSVTILQTINPSLYRTDKLRIKVVSKEVFNRELEQVGKDLPISGTPAELKADGRPNYKDLKDRSVKTASFPPADADGSCNPITGIEAYNFKQYVGEWAGQPTGLMRVCSKTTIPDMPDNAKAKQNEADYYNETHDGSNKKDPIQPPCCTPYSYSACGATSAAIVLAAYGELINPGITGEMSIQSGRTCNYGGMSPLAVLSYKTDYTSVVPERDGAKISAELKAGRPIIFACNDCRGADALSQYEINGRSLGKKIGSKGYGGHFMVLTGVYDDGNFAVADPGGTMNYINKSTILNSSKVIALYQLRRKDGKPIKACQ